MALFADLDQGASTVGGPRASSGLCPCFDWCVWSGPGSGLHGGRGGLTEVVEQLLDAPLGRCMSFDLALPAAPSGVVDELLLDGEARAQPGCVVAGGEELRAGQHEIAFARSLGGCAQAVAEFEFGLEEVGLQPVHGVGVEAVFA